MLLKQLSARGGRRSAEGECDNAQTLGTAALPALSKTPAASSISSTRGGDGMEEMAVLAGVKTSSLNSLQRCSLTPVSQVYF